jgi:hypothetical protein
MDNIVQSPHAGRKHVVIEIPIRSADQVRQALGQLACAIELRTLDQAPVFGDRAVLSGACDVLNAAMVVFAHGTHGGRDAGTPAADQCRPRAHRGGRSGGRQLR